MEDILIYFHPAPCKLYTRWPRQNPQRAPCREILFGNTMEFNGISSWMPVVNIYSVISKDKTIVNSWKGIGNKLYGMVVNASCPWAHQRPGLQATGIRLTDPEPKNLAQISGAPEEAGEFFCKFGLKSLRMETSGDRCEDVFPISAAHSSFSGYNVWGWRLY